MGLLCTGHGKGMETRKSRSFPLSFALKTGESEGWRGGSVPPAQGRLWEHRLRKG